MNVLVIGGDGYIGSYLCNYLQQEKITFQKYGDRKNDYNKLSKHFFAPFTHIILLAGHSSVQMCMGPLQSPWNNNVRNFRNLIEKLDKNQTLIYASSASVYGNKDNNFLYDENFLEVDYVNNYDLTKSYVDLFAMKKMIEGHRIFGLRFGTVNGESPVIRRDLMINSMVWSALKENKIIITNKLINRPILGINDLTRAMKALLIYNGPSDIFNLCSFNSNVEQISKIVSEHTNTMIEDRGCISGSYNFAIDNSKFRTKLNFDFDDDINSITENVIACYKNPETRVVIRNEYFNYD